LSGRISGIERIVFVSQVPASQTFPKAEALLKAPQTRLEYLDLRGVGMGDDGIAALSSLIPQGLFDQVKGFYFLATIA